jgi:hypothetical protein
MAKTFADKELGRACFGSFKECYKVLTARGVNLKDFPETIVRTARELDVPAPNMERLSGLIGAAA